MDYKDATIRLKYEDLPYTFTYKNQKGKIKKITIKKSDFVRIEHRGIVIYFNKKMFMNLERIVADVAYKIRDFLTIFAGPERVGKSYGKMQFFFVIDYILFKNHGIDMPFTINNVHFSAKDFLATRNKYNNVNFRSDDLDESKTDLDRKNRYEDIYKNFENYLAYCGSEYGFLSATLPLWSDISDYTILHRQTLTVIFKAYRDEDGRALKGIFDVFPIPYYDNVLVRGKTRDEIKEIINYAYKHKRFSPLPQSIKAMTGVCLDYEIINEKLYNDKKNKKKSEYIHKNQKKEIGNLTEREKEILTNMPISQMYHSKSAEYRVLLRLKQRIEKLTEDE